MTSYYCGRCSHHAGVHDGGDSGSKCAQCDCAAFLVQSGERPCTYCGKPTRDGFREYGGSTTPRCRTCPQPRQVSPHTPSTPDPWRTAMAEGIKCFCEPGYECAGHKWGLLPPATTTTER